MKKSLALVLALIMVLSSFSFVSAAPDFADVKGTKYEDAVARLELLNVLKGYPDGSFKPENTITRAEFAAVAVRAKGLAGVAEAAKGLPSGFSDVPAGHWAAGYVGVAGSTGIVNGIGGGLFAPNAPVKYEEAVTMLVRALGYEVSAQAKGGYPFGYLIVAKEIDLLDDVVGTMGVPATRGMVAMLTDNALEIPMMVQVGFGTDTKWVVSGTGDSEEEVFLLDFMGFKPVEGRVSIEDKDDLEIRIGGTKYDVRADFDFFVADGVEIKAWVDKDDLVVAYTLKETVKYDAVKDDVAKIKLITEDKSYTKESNVSAIGTGKVVNFAKVVFNKDGNIVNIIKYDLGAFMLVEKVDDGVVLDLNDDEWDLEDYTVVKGGKSVKAEDLVKGDIVFFDEDAELAVVYNKSVKGEIDRVYTNNTFRVAGKVYGIANDFLDVLYLDNGDLKALDDIEIIENMMDEGDDVEVFFDFNKQVVLVVGATGEGVDTTFYAVVNEASTEWMTRSGLMVSLDVLTEKGEEVAYDIKKADLADILPNSTTWSTIMLGDLVEITVDEDGEITGIKEIENGLTASKFETDDSYAKSDTVGYRLQASTVVFYDFKTVTIGEGQYKVPEKVITLGEIEDEFTVVEAGAKLFVSSERVKVVFAYDTDADSDYTSVSGLITRVRELRTGYFEVTIEVGGVEKVYLTEDKDIEPGYTNGFATIYVGDTSGKLVANSDGDYVTVLKPLYEGVEVKSRNTIARTLDVYDTETGTTTTIEMLSTTVIYDDAGDVAGIRDIMVGDIIDVYMDGSSRRFVKFIEVK